jgi:hypothetical protein
MWTEADHVSPFHGENRGSNPRGDATIGRFEGAKVGSGNFRVGIDWLLRVEI